MADHEERTWQCGPCGLCIGLAIGFIVAVAPFAWAGFAIYLGEWCQRANSATLAGVVGTCEAL